MKRRDLIKTVAVVGLMPAASLAHSDGRNGDARCIKENAAELDMLRSGVSSLDNVTSIQCSNGNWNCDEYMHGMANGLLLAQSFFKAGEIECLEKPETGYLPEFIGTIDTDSSSG